MPRPNPGPRLRQDATGIWKIRGSKLGRSFEVSTHTCDAGLAQERLRQFLNTESRHDVADFTGEECWLIYWTEHVLEHVIARDRLEFAWRRLAPAFGRRLLRQITTDDVHAYIARRRKAGAADSTIRRELSALATAVNHLIRTKRVNSTDTPYIPLPKGAPPRDRWLTTAEIETLLQTAAKRGPRIELFVHLALRTASRKRAIEQLRWHQVDLVRGLIDFNPTGVRQSNKRRPTVPISDRLRPLLEAAQRSATSPYVLGGGGSIRTAFEACVRAAGLADVTPHTLRHTWATHAAMNGVSMEEIARVLGDTIATVERTYVKWAPEYLKTAIDGGMRA